MSIAHLANSILRFLASFRYFFHFCPFSKVLSRLVASFGLPNDVGVIRWQVYVMSLLPDFEGAVIIHRRTGIAVI